MSIKTFSEKEIAKKILAKLKPERKSKRGSHRKRYIYLDGILITKVKIPNEHNKNMYESKSKYIAKDLKLNDDQFNNLIECPLTGPKYYEILRKKEKTKILSI